MSKEPLLSIQNLKTHFYLTAGILKAVDGVSLDIYPGESVGIVGESGSGKSVTALSIMRLVPMPPGRIVDGKILLEGENLLEKSEAEYRQIRGGSLAISFQDPMTYLNPVMRVGEQIAEAVLHHNPDASVDDALDRAIETMRLVGIPTPERRASDYPHQFSGGMRQRCLLAMAISCNPKLLIADEPTTALDVLIQAEILDLLRELKDNLNSSLMLITHDLGIVAELAERIAIMYAGRIMEVADTDTIFYESMNPYTEGLLASIPKLDATGPLKAIEGIVPDMLKPPPGCKFHPRCQYAKAECSKKVPELVEVEKCHMSACLFVEEIYS
jgi:oligopeptide/dipeptide ABC transporter ATP-binding protein